MSDFFKLTIVHSESHKIVPRITLGVLIILAIILFVQAILKAKKENRSLFDLKGKKFFIHNYDKVKFFGTIIILIIYMLIMNVIGFIFASIICISLLNILYSVKKDTKSICIGISIIETLTIWFIFGYLFDITLP